MMPIVLLFSLFLFSVNGFADEQIYFKIAVNDSSYSSFISDRISIEKSPMTYMATRMREQFFSVTDIDKAYYDITIVQSMAYGGKNVTQYDVKPKYNDRFRQVLIVDLSDGSVIHKDVYDTTGKLVFSFTSLESSKNAKPAQKDAVSVLSEAKSMCVKGFCLVGERMMKDGTKHIMLSDGLNKFSVFKKKISSDVSPSKKLVYGNYVMRKKQGDYLYTIVGTVPFSEMEYMVENFASLEVK